MIPVPPFSAQDARQNSVKPCHCRISRNVGSPGISVVLPHSFASIHVHIRAGLSSSSLARLCEPGLARETIAARSRAPGEWQVSLMGPLPFDISIAQPLHRTRRRTARTRWTWDRYIVTASAHRPPVNVTCPSKMYKGQAYLDCMPMRLSRHAGYVVQSYR